jgi:hypothetical protein
VIEFSGGSGLEGDIEFSSVAAYFRNRLATRHRGMSLALQTCLFGYICLQRLGQLL